MCSVIHRLSYTDPKLIEIGSSSTNDGALSDHSISVGDGVSEAYYISVSAVCAKLSTGNYLHSKHLLCM